MKVSRPASSVFFFFIALLVFLAPCRLYAASLPDVNRLVLPNGLVVLVSEDHSLPVVVFELLIDAGSRHDPKGAEGLAHFTAKGLLLGSARMRSTEINRTLDFLGASLGASASRDYSVVRLKVLKKDLDQGLELFVQAFSAPSFPLEELEKLKQRTLGDIKAADEEPLALAEKKFQEALFPDSPYGHPVRGTEGSVPRLTREQAIKFHQTFYHPNNAVLAIVGNVTAAELHERIAPRLTKLRKVQVDRTKFQGAYAQGPKTVKIDRKIAQTSIILGNEGLKRIDPDYYGAIVMSYILGGGNLQSRLMEAIRVKRGLAYSVMTVLDPEKYQGSFQIILQTKNESADQSIMLAKEQMGLMRTQPVTDQALERAKRYLVGSFPLRLDTQGKLAGILTRIEYYGLGLDYLGKYPSLINGVTKEDVLKASKRILHPDRVITVMVGDSGETH